MAIQNNIYFITVICKGIRYCQYTINDNLDSHGKTYDDMYSFLIPFCEQKLYVKINELLTARKSFIIDILKNEIILLEENKNESFADLRHKNLSLQASKAGENQLYKQSTGRSFENSSLNPFTKSEYTPLSKQKGFDVGNSYFNKNKKY